jgi:hypothetical protein
MKPVKLSKDVFMIKLPREGWTIWTYCKKTAETLKESLGQYTIGKDGFEDKPYFYWNFGE